jgi:hypothetical protein
MASLGGVLAAAIFKVVAGQIGSAIGGHIKLLKNFDQDLKKMKMALESVEAVIMTAERLSIIDEPTILWLKRLTDAMYDISSMFDEFQTDTLTSARKVILKPCS